jgi:type VI protein secretion system component VasF
MSNEMWSHAQDRLLTLGHRELQRAVPALTDMGVAPEQIRSSLISDLQAVQDHAEQAGTLPSRVFSAYSARLCRLEAAGIRLTSAYA